MSADKEVADEGIQMLQELYTKQVLPDQNEIRHDFWDKCFKQLQESCTKVINLFLNPPFDSIVMS